MSRYAFNRRDGNHAQIVDAFRAMGCGVRDLAPLKDDGPDLLVSCIGQNHLVEVKMPDGKLTDGQHDFARAWKAPVYICRSEETVASLVNYWRGQLYAEAEVVE